MTEDNDKAEYKSNSIAAKSAGKPKSKNKNGDKNVESKGIEEHQVNEWCR
jgi:hypothetical protein